ncbi:deacetylase [Spirochaetia bacterium]|nr:deacetylase [Spirochaetia bacterium]
MKCFIVTIDTEGDNLWNHRLGNKITCENARFIPRFQGLCDSFGFKPVYLTNYEMAQDDFFIPFAKNALQKGSCEIGLHLHAWNTPPQHDLRLSSSEQGMPYLIEYPAPIMAAKIDTMLDLFRKQFDTEIISHRAGRWAMNQTYFDLLIERGIQIDCSVTPHLSWETSRGLTEGSAGSDYRKSPEEPFQTAHSAARSSSNTSLWEVPVTIRKLHNIPGAGNGLRKIAASTKHTLLGKNVWFRPTGNNLDEMLALIDYIQHSDSDYLMFMLHSSELMPGGSPTFKTPESIERLYGDLEQIFARIAQNFKGVTLNEYYLQKQMKL